MKPVIASGKLHIKDLKNHLNADETVKTNQIAAFYRQYENDVSETTVNWRIHQLIQKGVLQRIGQGMFKLGQATPYIPDVSSQQKVIYQKLGKKFPYLDYCLWHTSVINEFMIHQPSQFFTLIEVEKEATNSVFHYLKDFKDNVFLEPSPEIVENYLPESKTAYIVKKLISEAPCQQTGDVNTATLEKILVDIFCDRIIFAAYQGAERTTIFKEAFNKYTVNQNKLFRYANRRGKKKELTAYLERLGLLAIKES